MALSPLVIFLNSGHLATSISLSPPYPPLKLLDAVAEPSLS